MKLKIKTINLKKSLPITKKKLTQKIRRILLLQNRIDANLSIVFVNDKLIKKLNKQFLNKNHPTDVLAFDLREKNQDKKALNGEIIISTDTAFRNAKEYKTTYKEELLLYVAHGILHLCGFDDRTKNKQEKMRKREQYLLKRI